MRLIDGDALQQHFADMQHYERCVCNFMDDGGEPSTEWYCVEDALENAPTVYAIPVWWLRDKMEKMNHAAEPHFAFMYVLREWQKEQEAQDE